MTTVNQINNKVLKKEVNKMYRLEVKVKRSWKLGWNAYNTIEEAEARKMQMESAGHKVRIVKTGW